MSCLTTVSFVIFKITSSPHKYAGVLPHRYNLSCLSVNDLFDLFLNDHPCFIFLVFRMTYLSDKTWQTYQDSQIQPTVGSPVFACHPDDRCWYRALVTKNLDQQVRRESSIYIEIMDSYCWTVNNTVASHIRQCGFGLNNDYVNIYIYAVGYKAKPDNQITFCFNVFHPKSVAFKLKTSIFSSYFLF